MRSVSVVAAAFVLVAALAASGCISEEPRLIKKTSTRTKEAKNLTAAPGEAINKTFDFALDKPIASAHFIVATNWTKLEIQAQITPRGGCYAIASEPPPDSTPPKIIAKSANKTIEVPLDGTPRCTPGGVKRTNPPRPIVFSKQGDSEVGPWVVTFTGRGALLELRLVAKGT